ncbi:MAG: ribosome silencing factor [Candidatus Phaeomarinobacter sp.]
MAAQETSFATSKSEDQNQSDRLRAAALACLDDTKAEDIVTIDLAGKSSMADCMVIASGRSQRHVGSVADYLVEALKKAGCKAPRVEGMTHADWVLIDAGDIVVHVFRPEVRDFYNLERLWSSDMPEDQLAN